MLTRLRKYAADLRTFPGDASLGYRNDGMQGVWDAFAQRWIFRVIRVGHLIVYAQPVDEAPEILPPVGVTISSLGSAAWPALAGLVPERTLDRFPELLAAGRHCLVAWRGSEPIGYAWVAERMGPDVTLCPLELPPYAAYLWDLYVLPRERRNGIGSALASARIRTARERGFREGWRMIAPSNHASLRTLARSAAGTRVVGEIRFVKIMTRMHVRFTLGALIPESVH